MSNERADIFQRVTDQIVKAIEEGAGALEMPWRVPGALPRFPTNAVSRKGYRGINILILWSLARERGYKSGTWATYKQWQELGAQVRKEEKSANVVFWKFLDKKETSDGDDRSSQKIPIARHYSLFNADQVEGYTFPSEIPVSRAERIEEAEEFFQRVGVEIKEGGGEASYSPLDDAIFMPSFLAFKEPLFYYSVLSHETTHWSGAPHRLNRDMNSRFGSESYAMEELVAELGAAFLCAELGLPSDPRKHHAPYIDGWLKALKNDKRAIFTAAAKAQEAVDYLTGRKAAEVEQ